jgi:hypothetical protein
MADEVSEMADPHPRRVRPPVASTRSFTGQWLVSDASTSRGGRKGAVLTKAPRRTKASSTQVSMICSTVVGTVTALGTPLWVLR